MATHSISIYKMISLIVIYCLYLKLSKNIVIFQNVDVHLLQVDVDF